MDKKILILAVVLIIIIISIAYLIISSYPGAFFAPILKTRCVQSEEICNGVDDDCDGQVDEGGVCEELAYAPGQFIVKFRKNSGITSETQASAYIKDYRVERVIEKNIVDDTYGLNRIFIVYVDPITNIPELVEQYKSDPNIEYAEPNYIRRVCVFPDDPLFDRQWNLNNSNDCDIDAPEAWDIETGDSDAIIAIIDTGVKYDHPDLQGNIWVNEDEIPDNGIDDDNNSYIDDYYGYDFCTRGQERDNDPMDEHGHGTSCSGVAAAVTNNSLGVAGVCWNCSIMSVRFIDASGWGNVEDGADAIIYATDNGADVISMSYGGSEESDLEKDALDYAYNNGVVLAAAAGNYDSDSKLYPAGYDNVIAVAATGTSDVKASFSNWGYWVDVAAPGVDIPSTAINGYYNAWDGTSMSCPHVSGLSGLILSQDPTRTNQDVMGRIMSTTDDFGDVFSYIGTGRINAFSALTASESPNLVLKKFEITEVTGNIDGYVDPGETIGLITRIWNTWLNVTNVSGTISTDNPYVSIVGNNYHFGDLHFDQEKNNSDQPFLLYIHEDIPFNHLITMNLELIGSGYVKDISINIVASPLFKLHNGWPFRPAADIVYFVASPTIFDVDNDGEKEVIFSSRESSGAWGWVYVKKHNGTTVDGWPQNIGPFGTKSSPAVGDIDGDGDFEVVIGSKNVGYNPEIYAETSGVYAWHHNGTLVDGWPVEFNQSETSSNPPISSPTLVDVDSDNDLEIIMATVKYVYLIDGNGDILSTFSMGFVAGVPDSASTPAVGDIDNNGDLEIVASNHIDYGSNLKVFRMSGSTMFTKSGIFLQPVIVDLDYDEDLEIIAGNVDGKVYAWHHNGNDVENWPQSTGGLISSIALGDIDNDADVEIVAGSDEGKVYAWHHNGTLVDGWPTDETVDPYYHKIAIVDMDDDPYMEVYVSDYRRIYVWNHDGTPIGQPLVLNKKIYAYPAFDDIDNDGKNELAISEKDRFYIFDINSSIFNPATMEWPMFQHDPQHTGLYACPLLGDVNYDGIIDCTDAQWILEMAVGLRPVDICGDVSGDGNVTVYDASLLIQEFNLTCTCSDGTSHGDCSPTKPKYCDNGELIDNCQLCDCPDNLPYCNTTNNGCEAKCPDGTPFGQCSANHRYCHDGQLEENCLICGWCPPGKYCEKPNPRCQGAETPMK